MMIKNLNYSLSLSLSLAARRDNNIIKKFHINKIAIKQREYSGRIGNVKSR